MSTRREDSQSMIVASTAVDGLVEHVSTCRLPTVHGAFMLHAWRERHGGREHLALVTGEIGDGHDVLVRVHSECLTSEVFGSLRCDCKPQLDIAMQRIGAEGRGVIVYLRGHEGRGIGLLQKVRAYALQDAGINTVAANLRLGLAVDCRDYGAGARILGQLGVRTVRLMTNNPHKCEALADSGIDIRERVPLVVTPRDENAAYLETKQQMLGHMLGLPAPRQCSREALPAPTMPFRVPPFRRGPADGQEQSPTTGSLLATRQARRPNARCRRDAGGRDVTKTSVGRARARRAQSVRRD